MRRHGALAGARRAIVLGLRPVLAPLAARRLRATGEAAPTTDELVDIAYSFDSFGIRIQPGQVRSEICGLLDILSAQRIRRVLEIGTQNGGSLFLLSQVAEPDALVISVDLPRGEFGGGYSAWRGPLYRRFGRRGQRMELIRGDSHELETFEQVKALLSGDLLDALFIDGDHTYEGVRHDFELYRPLVRDGGVIAFHDIAAGRAESEELRRVLEESRMLGGNVPQFWDEVKLRYRRTAEFTDSAYGFYGIGVVFVDAAA